ncbi:hypothetical protein CALVIDRAFT_318722 [Calocera viscosa TUFC12733]|uniref:Uncharacterized protein n=1 Tax=Calocera viscosa (strain TUFC12733) TaxID=1330018 RepID=A0A167HXT8_CALVF|nr:hypothetical protein CALVIDRAFT_318722 [Calocera viscosa TUFC12733]
MDPFHVEVQRARPFHGTLNCCSYMYKHILLLYMYGHNECQKPSQMVQPAARASSHGLLLAVPTEVHAPPLPALPAPLLPALPALALLALLPLDPLQRQPADDDKLLDLKRAAVHDERRVRICDALAVRRAELGSHLVVGAQELLRHVSNASRVRKGKSTCIKLLVGTISLPGPHAAVRVLHPRLTASLASSAPPPTAPNGLTVP